MVLLLMAATKPSSIRRILLVFSLMFSGTRTRLMAQFLSFPNAKPLYPLASAALPPNVELPPLSVISPPESTIVTSD